VTAARITDYALDTMTEALATATGGLVLHRDSPRDLTYTWFDQSPDPGDIAPRESGVQTSALVATDHAGACIGELRISFTDDIVSAAAFPTLLHWADDHGSWPLGINRPKRGVGAPPSPSRVWVRAHQHAQKRPASLRAIGLDIPFWDLAEAHAPTDQAMLDADLAQVAETARPRYQAWRDQLAIPFVAYSRVLGRRGEPGAYRGTGVGRTLYVLAGQQLGTTGRMLRASGNRTPEADTLWNRLIVDPSVPTTTVENTNYLSGKTSTHPALDYRRT
jgi:hypothetical protein